MAMKAHKLVGLDKPVYLPDDIVVEIAIVPASMTNIRSNQKRSASEVTTYTQHETANFNAGANADMHKRWLHSGAGGAFVGFNVVVDDRKIIQLTPFDEVTWAAGTPTGNRTSDHSELCVNSDIDHAKARRNAAALAAGVLTARGLTPDRLVQHNYWTGKNCPMLMRANNNAVWNGTFYPSVKTFYQSAEAPVTDPVRLYEPPLRIPEADGDETVVILKNGSTLLLTPALVETIKPTARLQTAWAHSKIVGPMIPEGERFTVRRLIVNADGSMYWYTPWATRIRFEDTRIVGAA